MPLYNYKCECGHEFDEVLKISERKLPTEQECPACGKLGTVEMQISTPRIVSGVGDFRAKVPDVFKDRLREIKKASGRGTTIDV